MRKFINHSLFPLLFAALAFLPAFASADKPSIVTAESKSIYSISDSERSSDSRSPSSSDRDGTVTQNYLADIRVHTPQELADILTRAEMLLDNGDFAAGKSAPVVFLLHGDEARILFKNQYSANKQVVDLAAKLTAFDVVDIRVCDAWLKRNNLDKTELQPFIESVKYAPAEKKRLLKEEQYSYF